MCSFSSAFPAPGAHLDDREQGSQYRLELSFILGANQLMLGMVLARKGQCHQAGGSCVSPSRFLAIYGNVPCCSMTSPRAASKTRGWQSCEEEEVGAEKWLREPDLTKVPRSSWSALLHDLWNRQALCCHPTFLFLVLWEGEIQKIGINKGNAVFGAVGCVPGLGKGSWCQCKQPSQLPPAASPQCLFKPTHCSANWEIGLENTAAANQNSWSLQLFQEECAPGKGSTLPCWDHPREQGVLG